MATRSPRLTVGGLLLPKFKSPQDVLLSRVGQMRFYGSGCATGARPAQETARAGASIRAEKNRL